MAKNTSTRTKTNRTTRMKVKDSATPPAQPALKTSPIREYSGRLNWASIGDRVFQLDGELYGASTELATVARILGDLGVDNEGYPAYQREAASEIRAAVKRGFDALFTAIRIAGSYDMVVALEGMLDPSPPPPPEDEIESM